MNLGNFQTSSNYLSLVRLLLAVPFWFILAGNSAEPNYAAVSLALFAAFTDIMDGFLARKLNQVTEWGKIIDPLADKVCIAVIVLQLYLQGKMGPLLFWIIISRDVLILIASLAVSNKLKKVLPSNYLGKITVLVICVYIVFLMLNMQVTYPDLGSLLYRASLIMIILSVAGYAMRAKEFLKGQAT